jgi:hypothetical protein
MFMTTLGLQFQELQEKNRSNLANEGLKAAEIAEKKRSNLVNESIGISTLEETIRNNTVRNQQGWREIDADLVKHSLKSADPVTAAQEALYLLRNNPLSTSAHANATGSDHIEAGVAGVGNLISSLFSTIVKALV